MMMMLVLMVGGGGEIKNRVYSTQTYTATDKSRVGFVSSRVQTEGGWGLGGLQGCSIDDVSILLCLTFVTHK